MLFLRASTILASPTGLTKKEKRTVCFLSLLERYRKNDKLLVVGYHPLTLGCEKDGLHSIRF